MWPEGAQDIAAVNKRPVTAGKSFRTSMKALVEQLEKKEPFYVRYAYLRRGLRVQAGVLRVHSC